eukprot:scaffold7837_cov89-Isochrysis_galbana.AAC.3
MSPTPVKASTRRQKDPRAAGARGADCVCPQCQCIDAHYFSAAEGRGGARITQRFTHISLHRRPQASSIDQLLVALCAP